MQDRIEAIRARCDAATRGPWKYDGMVYVWTDAFPMMMVADIRGWGYLTGTLGLSNEDASKQMDENAVFIAHAREDLPWALDRIAELKAALAEAQRRERAVDEIEAFTKTRMQQLTLEQALILQPVLNRIYKIRKNGPQAGEGKQDGN